MGSRQTQLNQLLDIGGIATLNNFYSPSAKTLKGSLLFTRKLFRSYVQDGLIEKIDSIGKPANKAREVFYCLTKKGAAYIGRANEYRYKKYQKSPYNILHESMKFDIALSLLRLFPHVKFTFRYDSTLYGVRPDITARLESKNPKELTRFLLIEIERKKTIDRVFKEKIKQYENMFEAIAKNKSHNINQFCVLFIYTDIWYDVFLRPQEYQDPKISNHITSVNNLLNNLVRHYCKHLQIQRYRFIGFHDFYRLNDLVWLTPQGYRVRLML